MSLVHQLTAWVLSWAESPFGAGALAFFSFIEAVFFPIPPDPLLITLGLSAPSMALLFAAICTAASVSGGMLGYLVGNKGGKPLLLRLFGEHKVAMVRRMYQKYDVWAVAIAAFTPIPYKVFTVSAGAFDLNVRRFVLASIIGRAGRFFLVGLLITVFGDAIRTFLSQYLELVTIGFMALLIAGFGVVTVLGRRARRIEAVEP